MVVVELVIEDVAEVRKDAEGVVRVVAIADEVEVEIKVETEVGMKIVVLVLPLVDDRVVVMDTVASVDVVDIARDDVDVDDMSANVGLLVNVDVLSVVVASKTAGSAFRAITAVDKGKAEEKEVEKVEILLSVSSPILSKYSMPLANPDPDPDVVLTETIGGR